MVAAAGYVLDSFGVFLIANSQAIITQIMAPPAIISEFALTLWLIIKGIKNVPNDRVLQAEAAPA